MDGQIVHVLAARDRIAEDIHRAGEQLGDDPLGRALGHVVARDKGDFTAAEVDQRIMQRSDRKARCTGSQPMAEPAHFMIHDPLGVRHR